VRKRYAPLALSLLIGLSGLVYPSDADDGVPFGQIREKDFDRFVTLVQSRGLDVNLEMEKVYKGDKVALAKVLELSTGFQKLDTMTRIYGNLMFSAFLNLVEERGEAFYADVLDLQSEEVRQRVRDFVYYGVTQVPKKHRAEVEREVRRDFPRVFPADYVYGNGKNPFS
jgi:hypothetical protein